jgi:ribose 5-phosphate isomerase B
MVVLDPRNARYGGHTVSTRRVVIASDHAGFELKQALVAQLRELGCDPVDLGTDGSQSVDYPDFADKLAAAMAQGQADTGVLVCGTGIGISIGANRHSHIRAGLAHDVTSARLMREHNDANVLALGARLIGLATACDCLKVFLETSFEGGRHQRRVDKLSPPPATPRPA